MQERPALLTVAGAFYVWVHVPAMLGALAWVWLKRRRSFPFARDSFVLSQAVIVAGYLAAPTAPPRLLEGLGFRDTLAQLWGPDAASVAHSVQSPYAAMPSGHVAFALIVAACVGGGGASRALRLIAPAYPALVLVVVLATANHFWLDAVGGALATVAGLILARLPAAVRERRARAPAVRAVASRGPGGRA